MKIVLLFVGLVAALIPLTGVHAQADACEYIVEDNVIPLYSAPLNIASLQIDVLQVGNTYTVEKRAERYLYVSGEEVEGWIHGLSLGGRTEGECSSLPEDARLLTEYPPVCFFTPVEAMRVYNDPSLTEQHHAFDLQGGQSYPVVFEHEASFFAYIDDAAGGWVSGDAGFLSGSCDELPQQDSYQQEAVALENARLWSQPNVRIGTVIADVAPETGLYVISGPVQGPIRVDTDDLGQWFYVSTGEQSGWLWEARFEFKEVSGDESESVLALENARLWSLPNVQQGSLIAFVNPGSEVLILQGPVNGPIRFDTIDTGDWYFVEVGTMRGWIWEGRLALDD